MRTAINFLHSYLYDGLPFVLLFSPTYIFIRGFIDYIRKQYRKFYKSDFYREIIMYFFFVFLTLLFVQTFVVNQGENKINLIPFSIIIKQVQAMRTDLASFQMFVLNIFGNIVIFLPIGMFISYLFKKDIPKTTMIGFLISLTIEGGQLPLDRTSDVDDLILNTTGAFLGACIYYILYETASKIKK